MALKFNETINIFLCKNIFVDAFRCNERYNWKINKLKPTLIYNLHNTTNYFGFNTIHVYDGCLTFRNAIPNVIVLLYLYLYMYLFWATSEKNVP